MGGESLKRALAKEVSKQIPNYVVLKHVPPPIERSYLLIEQKEEIDLKLNPSILQQGWSAIKHAAEVVGNKTAAVVESLVDKTSHVAESVGHKTSDVVEQLVDKTALVATQVAHSTSDMATQAAHTTADFGQQIAEKTEHLIADMAPKVAHATSEAAIHLGHQMEDMASYVGHKFEEKMHEIKDDAGKLYVKAQEKMEQARRMASGEEQCALLNAMAVSALIAELDSSFYKQTGVNKLYGVKLLESMEVKWRIFHELDGCAIANAKKESKLIQNYFASKTTIIPEVPLKMVEVVETKVVEVETKVVEVETIRKKAPYTAAK